MLTTDSSHRGNCSRLAWSANVVVVVVVAISERGLGSLSIAPTQLSVISYQPRLYKHRSHHTLWNSTQRHDLTTLHLSFTNRLLHKPLITMGGVGSGGYKNSPGDVETHSAWTLIEPIPGTAQVMKPIYLLAMSQHSVNITETAPSTMQALQQGDGSAHIPSKSSPLHMSSVP